MARNVLDTHGARPVEGRTGASVWMAACVGLALTACGGGGGDSPAETPTPAGRSVSGVLLVPETTVETTRVATAMSAGRGREVIRATDPSCIHVPVGYTPITNAPVSFTDGSGGAVGGSAVTDICGRFTATGVATEAVNVSFPASTVNQALNVPIAALGDRDGDGRVDPITAVPTGATLEIAGATVFGDRLTFIVRDSVTRKAVLGIPASAVTVNGPSGAVPVAQFAYTASSGPTSISLVLDASGSMSSLAASGSTLTRYQVTAAASKLFVDRVGATDQVGMVVFESTADFLNPEFFTTTWGGRIVDAAGQLVPLGLPATGFSSDRTTLNRLVDFYNPSSDAWQLSTAPLRFVDRRYPWGGSTAIWDATGLGLDRVVTQAGRQFIITMTDGADNASRTTVASLTTRAVAARVPVFTVGIGSVTSLNTANLENLANATGGTFTRVDSSDVQALLAGTFDAIRTGIQFQYGGTLSGVTAGSALRIQVNHAGLQLETPVVAN